MSRHFIDYDGDSFCTALSDRTAMDSDGHVMMRMSEHTAMNMDTGEVHRISSWRNDDDDDDRSRFGSDNGDGFFRRRRDDD